MILACIVLVAKKLWNRGAKDRSVMILGTTVSLSLDIFFASFDTFVFAFSSTFGPCPTCPEMHCSTFIATESHLRGPGKRRNSGG